MFSPLKRLRLHEADILDTGGAGGEPNAESTPEQRFTVFDEIEKVERQYTPEQAAKLIQAGLRAEERVRGADRKFQETAEQRKAGEALQALVDGAKGRDKSSFQKLAGMLDLDTEHPGLSDEIFGVLSGEPAPAGGTSDKPGEAVPAETLAAMAKLPQFQQMSRFFKALAEKGIENPEDAAACLLVGTGAANEWSTEKSKKLVSSALTKHPTLGKILQSGSKKAESLDGAIYGDFVNRVNSGTPLDDAIQQAVDYAATVMDAAPTAPQSPGQSPFVGIGPAPAVSSGGSLHSTEKPKVDIGKLGDPNYFDTVVDRIVDWHNGQENRPDE